MSDGCIIIQHTTWLNNYLTSYCSMWLHTTQKKRENYIFSAVVIAGIEKQHIYNYCNMWWDFQEVLFVFARQFFLFVIKYNTYIVSCVFCTYDDFHHTSLQSYAPLTLQTSVFSSEVFMEESTDDPSAHKNLCRHNPLVCDPTFAMKFAKCWPIKCLSSSVNCPSKCTLVGFAGDVCLI